MRQQTKSFIVEKKQSRKLKPGSRKPSIWGKLDLSITDSPAAHMSATPEPATAESGDRI